MTAPLKPKLLKESTFQNLVAAEQARNATLTDLLEAIENNSTDIPAWVTAALGLPTVQKTALKSALYEVLGLNNSVQKSVEALPDIYAILDDNADAGNGAGLHNSIYRGKNLGSEPTADHYARINDATFKGLWMGDYYAKSVTYNYPDQSKENNALTSITQTLTERYLHHNYRKNCGDTAPSKNHSLMAADQSLFSAPMNKGANKTEGGYVGSDMYTIYLDGALNAFNAFFGSTHILEHRELLVNAVASGRPSAGSWYSRKVDLMNECMVYGSYIFTPGNDGVTIPYRYTIDKSQLAAFHLNPSLISTRYWWWLMNVVSAASFAYVGNYGYAVCTLASVVAGVRPAALICQ